MPTLSCLSAAHIWDHSWRAGAMLLIVMQPVTETFPLLQLQAGAS